MFLTQLLLQASSSFNNWFANVEYAGQNTHEVKLPGSKKMKNLKDKFNAKRAWKVAGLRVRFAANLQQEPLRSAKLREALGKMSQKEGEAIRLLSSINS